MIAASANTTKAEKVNEDRGDLGVTKNRCVTHVKICEYANFVSSLLAYLISTVVS